MNIQPIKEAELEEIVGGAVTLDLIVLLNALGVPQIAIDKAPNSVPPQ